MKMAPSNKRGGKKGKWACFNCRLCFKETTVCPSCKESMPEVGSRFKAPKRNDVKEWTILGLWHYRSDRGKVIYGGKPATVKEAKQRYTEELRYKYDHKITNYGRWSHPSVLFPYVTFK